MDKHVRRISFRQKAAEEKETLQLSAEKKYPVDFALLEIAKDGFLSDLIDKQLLLTIQWNKSEKIIFYCNLFRS